MAVFEHRFSQGSVATCFKHGGYLNMTIANLPLSLKVKEFYVQSIVAVFLSRPSVFICFWLQCNSAVQWCLAWPQFVIFLQHGTGGVIGF